METIKFRIYNSEEKKMWESDATPMMLKSFFENTARFNTQLKMPYQQFTGLLDRFGKEIYEGDIVRFEMTRKQLVDHPIMTSFHDETAIYQGAVVWGICGWRPFIDGVMISKTEVIGNIYENPDLLK